MKYVFLFCGTPEDQRAFDSLTPEQLREQYGRVGRWFAEHRERIGHTNQLQGLATATMVRFEGGKPMVKDGMFIEGKEYVGGYAEVEVADLDEALAMAKTWPGGGTVEIRPLMTER
ncbi:MAG: hypothetical protein J2P45_14770 [Candidatus Dormibacteraeota bacterium]|nr:hypothetical protein [Candidatus Dormibacteraeota bacterium]